MATNSVEVLGLKEALRELNTIDKKLRREITRDFKQIVQPVLGKAESLLPSGAPLSGMARSWKGKSGADIMSWNDARVRRNIKAFTSGKKVRDAPGGFKQNLGVFGIRWLGPQATALDFLAKGTMGENLTARFGPPSRIIYKAYESASADVERQVKELVNKVMKLTNNAMRV
ncbi:hypothetical protein UFOVP290_10 [uncultured Caudovirales phage]|uniref:Uncharacterized protein n=1 Tax=uncultured Caudovirales phage TaxID=2100421 RepID=A0A6J5Q3I1_9CAUD|nr:hypothetical protein UFOVP290_10 [uncultured Caudovirales phage]CAB4176088.1 hypothetical protein UFOVP982_10 [uncultured Caudovirales phage]CAB4194835.1 hypothetical protein UFOVP1265_23 [uncultured Caudovirales phage]